MNKSFLKLSVTALFLVFFSECYTPSQVIINYEAIRVPEEGGISFTQYTSNDEGVLGPFIKKRENGTLAWYAPAFIDVSEDGKHLAFIGRKAGTTNIFLKNTEGGKTKIQRTFRDRVLSASFSPNGEKIVFTDVNPDGGRNIFVINSRQGAAIQQITASGDSEGAVFSPDNNKIFFTKTESGRFYIWSFDVNSSLMTQYGEGFTPSLAPNGEDLVVTRNNKNTSRGEIWMINIKTGQETLLLSDSERGFSSPRISPDGKKVVCVGTTPETTTRQSNLDVYSFNIDGTGLTQHTFHEGHDVSPVWANAENAIYFMAQRGNEEGFFNIWKMLI